MRLIDAALTSSPGGSREWGICTECGMGRADRQDMPVLLDLHRQVLAADLKRAFGGPLPSARFFHSVPVSLAGRTFRALRHNMAGQDGYEFITRS